MIDERVKAIKARIQARKLDVGEFTENEYTERVKAIKARIQARIQGAKQGLLDDNYAPSFADLAANAYSDITFLLAEVERLQVEIQVRDSLLGPVIDDTLKGGE